MQLSATKRLSSPKVYSLASLKRNKRYAHIKSLPSKQGESRTPNLYESKVQATHKPQIEVKLKKFKSQQCIKISNLAINGTIGIIRQKSHAEQKKKQRQSLYKISKQLTKSTNQKSSFVQKEPHSTKRTKRQKLSTSKNTQISESRQILMKSMLKRLKTTLEEYQLKLNKNILEKDKLKKQNETLKHQLDLIHKKNR